MKIELSDRAISEMLKLQAIESGRVGNFSRIEGVINCLRYKVFDLVMSEAMKQLEILQKK